jgi:hypothetical protein
MPESVTDRPTKTCIDGGDPIPGSIARAAPRGDDEKADGKRRNRSG